MKAPDSRPRSGELSITALRREARVAAALREVAGALGASLELDELLELVLGNLTDLLDAERAILFQLDERTRELVSRSMGGDDDFPLRLPLSEGVLSRVARTGRPIRIDAAASKEPLDWDEVLSIETRSAIAAPLKNNLSRTIGVLLVINKRGGRKNFDEQDEDILSVLAKQAAVAIDNSRLLITLIRKNQQLQQAQEQLTRRVRDLELLFELERSTAHAHSHEELASAVLLRLARACNAGGALLVLSDETHEQFVDYCLIREPRSAGTEESPARFWSRISSVSEGILASVIEVGVPIQIDAADSPLTHHGLPEVVSMIAEPLEREEQPLGGLALINKRGGPFTAEDLGLLRLVSANISTAVRLFNTNVARERGERLSSIGRLMAQVVHDLKSPLTVISGYVQLMEESSSREQRGDYAAEILKQFDALGAMQREVLAFARGETEVFSRKVIVDRLLAELSATMKAELDEKSVELKVSSAKRLTAYFDSERVTRALANLVRNAAEAMESLGGGTVTVRADAEGRDLTLRVSDTGPGIPPSIAPRLFQSFVTAGKVHGTGLGLAIVKRIVEEHGGSVQVSPVPRGACFLIRLPDAVPSERAEAENLQTTEDPGGESSTTGARGEQSRSFDGPSREDARKAPVEGRSGSKKAAPARSRSSPGKRATPKPGAGRAPRRGDAAPRKAASGPRRGAAKKKASKAKKGGS